MQTDEPFIWVCPECGFENKPNESKKVCSHFDEMAMQEGERVMGLININQRLFEDWNQHRMVGLHVAPYATVPISRKTLKRWTTIRR